jgi:hypothetical protein
MPVEAAAETSDVRRVECGVGEETRVAMEKLEDDRLFHGDSSLVSY